MSEPTPSTDTASLIQRLTQALGEVVDPVYGKPMMAFGSLTLHEEKGQEGLVAEDIAHKGQGRVIIRMVTPMASMRDELMRLVNEKLKPFMDTPEIRSKLSVEVSVKTPGREVVHDDPIPQVKNIILVMSGKGGVGKSTTACNLSVAIQSLGYRVGLLDADIYGPSIPTMFGVNEGVYSTDGKRFAPKERFGVKLMSMGFLLENDKQAIIWRGPMLHGALHQLLKDVDWGELDYLVLDLPPGTGDVQLTMAQRLKVTGAVIVTTPQEVALADVYKCVSMCKNQNLNIPILGVVENMSTFLDSAGVKHAIFGKGGGAKIAEYAEAPLLAQLPLDSEVGVWADQGMPYVAAKPDSDVAMQYKALALSLVERIANTHAERYKDRTGKDEIPSDKQPSRLKIMR